MSLDSTWPMETADYEGNRVLLSAATWHAKTVAHPEIRDYLAEIQPAIETPDLVFASTRDIRARVFYRLFVGRQKLEGKHLVVVVKYIQEDERRGYVSTIYLSRAVYSRGDILWKNLETNFPFE